MCYFFEEEEASQHPIKNYAILNLQTINLNQVVSAIY